MKLNEREALAVAELAKCSKDNTVEISRSLFGRPPADGGPGVIEAAIKPRDRRWCAEYTVSWTGVIRTFPAGTLLRWQSVESQETRQIA